MASYIQNKKVIVVLFFILSIPYLSFPLSAHAHGDFSVSPLFTELSLDTSEQTKNFFLTVSNTTSEPVVMRLSLLDFGSLDESGGIAFLGTESSGANRYALASWIIPEKDVVTLLPGSKEELRFTVENRESLSPGGHYGAVLFSIENEGGDTGAKPSEVSVNSNFSALIFAKKEGGALPELSLKDQSTEEQSWITGLPRKIALRFQNSGNIDVVPRGRITVTDSMGRIVAKSVLNEDSSRILPESFRVYRLLLTSIYPAVLPGWYTISTEYRFDGNETLVRPSQRRVFAWGITIWWGIGLIALFLIFRRLTRFLKSKMT